MSELYIGLMSGTSMDGIDAALVRFSERTLEVLTTCDLPYPVELQSRLLSARENAELRSPADVPDLHTAVGESFRNAAVHLLSVAGIQPEAVTAIGSHGQTLRHEPAAAPPFSLQIGDAQIIADGTGITTIADFRSADIRLGGQGAPLAPAFHEWLFRAPDAHRVVLNIGGIANVTILPAGESVTTGFDTGPGNTLLDAWIRKHLDRAFDHEGAWAAQGVIHFDLLERLLSDPWFSVPPPKSTGFEYFNLHWLDDFGVDEFEPADVQATLCLLTARSIAESLPPATSEILVCGGGVHNCRLMHLLASERPGISLRSTADAGLDPDWVEAAAFAWLAMRTMHGLPGNLPAVTGASAPAVLGRTWQAC